MTAKTDQLNIDSPIKNSGDQSIIKNNNNYYNSLNSSGTDFETAKSSNEAATSSKSGSEDVFEIAAKAEKLLQEILSSSKSSHSNNHAPSSVIKQEPSVQIQQQQLNYSANAINSQNNMSGNVQQFYATASQNSLPNAYFQQNTIQPMQAQLNVYATLTPHHQFIYQTGGGGPGQGPSFYMKHPPPIVAPMNVLANNQIHQIGASITQQPYYYQQQRLNHPGYFQQQPSFIHPYQQHQIHHMPPPQIHSSQIPYQYMQSGGPLTQSTPSYGFPPNNNNNTNNYNNNNSNNNNNAFFRKRKFGEINNNYNNNNNNGYNRFKTNESNNSNYQNNSKSYYQNGIQPSSLNGTSTGSNSNGSMYENNINKIKLSGENGVIESNGMIGASLGNPLNEEDVDLNIMRERELKDLKCKSVVEKMSVFLKYYQQFKESYIMRIQTIECSDSLKIQFHSLVKYLNEYEALLAELNMMITEHERDHCKNNHRKTKKFFNKTKAFIRYECNKRLQSNIFEYRRLINSQDRYAGMYDLLDMNSYLISLLPDIGVSIRRYINRCEKARQQEQLEEEEEEFHAWQSENSNDSANERTNTDVTDLSIPTFKEFVAQTANRNNEDDDVDNDDDDDDDDDEDNNEDDETNNGEKENIRKKKKVASDLSLLETLSDDTSGLGTSILSSSGSGEKKTYESFSKGIDSLNRYLLKRVDEEESLDELVKERIIKWINKRQAKYILIFSEVDKLLNQHKTGECYSKFHSYLLFNLGKLVTVCDSYHQKLKELLYSTTIRRKKKRKKVKLLPEAMSDVFDEINDLKRALEYAKLSIKRCNGKDATKSF